MTTIDPRLDAVVWGALLLLFLVMGARAWAVETAEAGQYRKSARVRMMNGATAFALVLLVGLMAMQGGVALVQAIATRTEPDTFVTVVGDEGDKDQAVPDPDSQSGPPAPVDPNAPPAGAPPAANPGGAPAGGGAPAPPGG
jgi:hypothetical protein